MTSRTTTAHASFPPPLIQDPAPGTRWRGQLDAAFSLWFSRGRSMLPVIPPQAISLAIPPLVNCFSALLNESSLVSVLAITELARVSQLVYTRTFRAYEVYLAAGALHLVMTRTASRFSSFLESGFRVSNRLYGSIPTIAYPYFHRNFQLENQEAVT